MADDTPIDSLLVKIGFAPPDAAGARAAVDAVKKAEADITAVQGREGAKRAATETQAQGDTIKRLQSWLAQRKEAEEKAHDERAKATAEFVGGMLGLNKDQSADLLKHTREGASKSVEVERDKAKKVSLIRAGQFKEASVDLLKFGAIAEKISGGLASALTAAPFGAFLLGVERTASGLSNLAVQSQRVGSSAAGIERFLFAMKQQGVSEAEATGALEGFASTMKSNPEGYRRALEGLPGGGVRTLGPDGKPLGYDGMLENFEGYLARQPFNIAKMQAGQFGITGDNAIAALRDPAATRKGLQGFDAKLSAFGFDPNNAAEDARKVQQSWNNLEADFAIIKQKLDSEFFLPMMTSLDALAKKMEANPQTVENFGRALEALAIGVSARVLPTLANLAVKLSGLEPIIGGVVGAALRIAVNPVVALGASAESTPGAGVPADDAERAKVEAENKRLTDEANRKQGSTGSFWQDSWNYIKGKVGLGDDKKVASDIATTAEATKKLADRADGIGGAEGGGGVLGAARRALGWAATAGGNAPRKGVVGNFGEKGWWNPDRQSHAVDVLMKEAGLTEDGAKALVARWKFVESAGGPNSVNPRSGAAGIAQGLGSRRAGYTGSFDDQLKNAARELNGAEGRAKRMLNTPGMEATGASQFERAEGYNARTGEDNFTARTREGMKHIVHGANGGGSTPTTTPTVTVNGTPSHSDAPVGDQAALDAQNRIIAGKGRPADHALIEAHRRQQNTPAAVPPVTSESYDAAKRVAEIAKGRDMSKATDAERRAVAMTKGIIDRYEKEHPRAAAATTATAPYAEDQRRQHGSGNTLNDLERSGRLDAAHQKLADAMRSGASGNPIKVEVTKPLPGTADLHKAILRHAAAGIVPTLHHPLGVTPANMNVRHGDRSQTIHRAGDTFNVHGTDAKSGLDHAVKVSARREGQDRIRYGQGSQQ